MSRLGGIGNTFKPKPIPPTKFEGILVDGSEKYGGILLPG